MAENQTIFLDGISSFELGMDSGKAPYLLPRNKLSFALNATVRGSFITHRPAYINRGLVFSNTDQADNFQTKLWQGGCYYKPDVGMETLMAAIGGRLFQLTPDATIANWTVADKTPTDDLNPPSTPQAWLWQAENFVIWQDGASIPIFFDGSTSRRSRLAAQVFGELAAPFVGVDPGDTVLVTLTDVYTGPFNVTCTVGGKTYLIKEAASGYPVTLVDLPVSGSGLYLTSLFAGTQLLECNASTFGSNTTTSGTPVLVGEVLTAVPIPGVGGTPFTVILKNIYSGAVPTASGRGIITNLGARNVFRVLSQSAPSPTNQVYLESIDDSAGTPHAAGEQLITVPELPAGRMGAYGLGRNWLCLTDGLSYVAGDIVGGGVTGGASGSGTAAYNYRDSVLKMTENTFLHGGGVFRIPGSGGIIRAMVFTANLDTSLGQGPLQVGTANIIFSCNAPIDRDTWQDLTNPIQTQSLIGFGPLGQNSTVLVNSDTLFRSSVGLGSLQLARRDFSEGINWGNTPISREMQRVITEDSTALLGYGSAVNFSNRLLMTSKPTPMTGGIGHRGIIALNFDPVSEIGKKSPPVYDGLWTGLNVLQLMEGRFDGTPRCLAFAYNREVDKIQLFEIAGDDRIKFDHDGTSDVRIKWEFETSCLFRDVKGKNILDIIKLIDGEFAVADVVGTVDYEVYYRAQFSRCWTFWNSGSICAETSTTDNSVRPQNRVSIGLGMPDIKVCDPSNQRPTAIAESFQFKFVFTGSCKFYGAIFKASPEPKTEFERPQCKPICVGEVDESCEPCRNLVCTPDDDYEFYQLQDRLIVPSGPPVYNNTVYASCPNGQTLSVIGTLPNWISFDSGNGRLVGAAGTFQGSSKSDANQAAQSALDAFVISAQGTSIECTSPSNICPDGPQSDDPLFDNVYQIQGYVDAFFANADPCPTSFKTLWDGKFDKTVFSSSNYWVSGDAGEHYMDGHGFCIAYIRFVECIAEVPQWELVITKCDDGVLWSGSKSGGNDPEGTYIRTGGDDALPASVVIELGAGSTSAGGVIPCVT